MKYLRTMQAYAGSEEGRKCSKMLIAAAAEIAAMKRSRSFLDPRYVKLIKKNIWTRPVAKAGQDCGQRRDVIVTSEKLALITF